MTTRSAWVRHVHRAVLALGAGLPFLADMHAPERDPPSEKRSFQVLAGRAQGTTWQIRYASEVPLIDSSRAAYLFREVDRSLSLYQDSSLISRFNRSAAGVVADKHLLRVVGRSIQVFEASRGAFDITVKPLMDLFRTHPDASARRVADAMRCMGSQRIRIRGDSLSKDCSALQIDCNGIAQGYTVDLFADLLETNGVADYLVELGGEIRSRGNNAKGEPWVLGVEVPMEDGMADGIGKRLRPEGRAVTTSGNWHLKRGADGRPVVHIIDPRTGRPSNNGMISATVLARDAMTADALDNVCMVLGPRKAMAFIDAMPDVEAWIVFKDEQGRLRDTSSSGFECHEVQRFPKTPVTEAPIRPELRRP
jgi:thiamine biosynthesis lipoprotein